MDEKLCEAVRKPLVDKINALTNTVERQSLEIATMQLDIAGQAKDTLHLQQAINTLQKSIDTLVEVIDQMKYKPVKNYEKVVWIVMTAIISVILTRAGLK